MSLDPLLLEMLACPAEDHAPLQYDADKQTFTCPDCARVYEVRDGLPVLLIDEAVK
ncbi:Trm112 family protein [Catelliglobosispora koreensis]|uniref:Trm112 family protein n=1 Tax=Catelliglobosispora koreensis TaxID=129052 RepID=UPI000375FA30|nr:Trm112 family protein [Catelliglobosispora koreensis]